MRERGVGAEAKSSERVRSRSIRINPREEAEKRKAHPEAFWRYSAPLTLLPNWCLGSVRAI